MALEEFTNQHWHWRYTADSSLLGTLNGTVPAWTSCFNLYLCSSRGAAGFVRPKPPLPETALTEGCWELVIPYRPKTIEITLQERLKDTRKRILLSLPETRAPVRLEVAAPPLREASAGGWQRARGQAYINGKENPLTLQMAQWRLWGRIFFFFSSVFFMLD